MVPREPAVDCDRVLVCGEEYVLDVFVGPVSRGGRLDFEGLSPESLPSLLSLAALPERRRMNVKKLVCFIILTGFRLRRY